MANTYSFHFLLLMLFSLSLQLHARESKFFTNVIHYLSNSPTISPSSVLVPAPAPALALISELAPMSERFLAPAKAPAEKEYGYGLYGQGSSESSSEKYYRSSLEGSNGGSLQDEEEKATPREFNTEKEPSFDKLLSRKSFSTSDNGHPNNEPSYSSSMNEKNGYNQNGQNNGDGYNSKTGYNENGYNQNDYNENGYDHDVYGNNYKENVNTYTSKLKENNDYMTGRYSQNNKYMSFTNDNRFASSNEQNSGYNNRYMVKQQGLSDTRFLDNGKNLYDENNNGNSRETIYEKEVRDNGAGYYGNNEKSKYEFDTMEEYERQEGYPESDQQGYVP